MSERILIIGAGGHGQVVADALLQMQHAGAAVQPIGFLDDDERLIGRRILGLPVLGATNALTAVAPDSVVLALGDNQLRRTLFVALQAQGMCFTVVQHPTAVVAPDVRVGSGTMILAGAVINTGSHIGANCIINTRSSVDHHNQIGPHVHVAPGVTTGGNVTVEEGALVGIGATVMPGRRVGSWSIVGAAALVHRDVAPRSMVTGVPARPTAQLE